MINLSAIGHEFRRILFSRKYFYMLLLVGLSTHGTLSGHIMGGVYGTSPFSRLSYAKFLTMSNPLLLLSLAFLCTAVFSEKEIAARKILFSTPISPVEYFAIKGAAIACAYLLLAALLMLYSFAFYGWHFRFFHYTEFIHPMLVFLLSPAIFVFGLSMVAGKFSGKLLYGLLPVLFLFGAFNMGLPVWADLCGNNFLINYSKMILQTFGNQDMVYHVPRAFLLSRLLMALTGIALFAVACRKIKC